MTTVLSRTVTPNLANLPVNALANLSREQADTLNAYIDEFVNDTLYRVLNPDAGGPIASLYEIEGFLVAMILNPDTEEHQACVLTDEDAFHALDVVVDIVATRNRICLCQTPDCETCESEATYVDYDGLGYYDDYDL